ncbi:hypothetical protein SLEP1_g18845 [Rubroshorea leprosula]|uniref:Uncharacterized protein n=1 Tax=Rubroshorea leprosula TaxID=152421 RepID=A0AAV5J4V5_9ROSI|nr:hypothetical protein SLEP1_g18845 [Rubroshorea leprosula]
MMLKISRSSCCNLPISRSVLDLLSTMRDHHFPVSSAKKSTLLLIFSSLIEVG